MAIDTITRTHTTFSRREIATKRDMSNKITPVIKNIQRLDLEGFGLNHIGIHISFAEINLRSSGEEPSI
jgi:hypothetical protein